jgi:peptidoglycan DL-endopeptidase CwlO
VSTPLTGITDTVSALVTEQAGVAGRGGLVLAVTSGLVAGMGLPSSTGARSASRTATSDASGTLLSPASQDLTPGLTAPADARVTFERDAFRPAVDGRLSAPTPASLTGEISQVSRALARAAYLQHLRTIAARPSPVAHRALAMHKAASVRKAAPVRRTAPVHRAAPAHRTTVRTTVRTTTSHTTRPVVHVSGSARGASVVALASRYLGVPYRYGGSSPRGFDCSGLTQYVYGLLGVRLPRTAAQQYGATRHLQRSQARPGDLVFFFSGGVVTHVGIYLGGNLMIAAPHTGDVVKRQTIYSANVAFGRV